MKPERRYWLDTVYDRFDRKRLVELVREAGFPLDEDEVALTSRSELIDVLLDAAVEAEYDAEAAHEEYPLRRPIRTPVPPWLGEATGRVHLRWADDWRGALRRLRGRVHRARPSRRDRQRRGDPRIPQPRPLTVQPSSGTLTRAAPTKGTVRVDGDLSRLVAPTLLVPPLLGEDRVDVLVGPLAFPPGGLPMVRFAAHADALEKCRRADVAGVAVGGDPVDAVLGEQQRHDRAQCLGGEPAALRVSG